MIYRLLICLALCLAACEKGPNRSKEGTVTHSKSSKQKLQKLRPAPDFNKDSAYRFVERQVAFGPRVPGTQAHQACGDWLVQRLKAFGGRVTVQQFEAQSYKGEALKGRNIFAAFYPRKKRRILLAAHWDTRPFSDHDPYKPDQPFDGANDGGSGVGVLLEVARALQQADLEPDVGVDILFFDLEDYGPPESEAPDFTPKSGETFWCLGSQHWAQNKHDPNYFAYYGILLDMVGNPNATFYQEGASMAFAPKVVDKVWNIAHKLGHKDYFIQQMAPRITDDHVFVNHYAHINMIDIVAHNPRSGGYFPDTWHTQQDNMGHIDANTLKVVGQTVLQTIFQEEGPNA